MEQEPTAVNPFSPSPLLLLSLIRVAASLQAMGATNVHVL